MASRVELAQQYMDHFAAQKTDETLAMMSDDVVMTSPMTGTTTGKAALQAQLAAAPQGGGGGMNINWGSPEGDGNGVKIVGTGSPFGPVKIGLGFNDADEINRIDIGLA
jgi:hypothetical protein